jgi:ceroid-lipofuscinosis MFS transporter 7
MQKQLLALTVIGLVDAISYMVVTPSLIFYILKCGGNLKQYGLILSLFSFASFAAKPFLGYWVDVSGNKFRTPYFVSTFFGIIGGLAYFLANHFNGFPFVSVGLIALGRILGGVAAANQAIGYAYVAFVVPQEQQTQFNSALSLVRVVGMAAGPGFNVVLAKVNFEISFGQTTLSFDPLNSVGFLLAILNVISIIGVYFLLPEPPEREEKDVPITVEANNKDDESGLSKTMRALLSLDILLPIFVVFLFNSCFQV